MNGIITLGGNGGLGEGDAELQEQKCYGILYPASGIALIRKGEDFYFIQLSANAYKEVVHLLSSEERRHIYAHNLYAEESEKLSEAEIGEYPFVDLVQMLRYRERLQSCMRRIEILLNALGEDEADLRYEAACFIEDMLEHFPQSQKMIEKRFCEFIPPEDYHFDGDEVLGGYDAYVALMKGELEGYDENDLEHTYIRQSLEPCDTTFDRAFPRLYALLLNASQEWNKTINIVGIQRVTRAQIQQRQDRRTEIASQNILENSQTIVATFQECLKEITANRSAETKWKNHKALADAKGRLLSYGNPRDQRSRYEDANSRIGGILDRFDRACEFLAEATTLLQQIEKLLGEIEATPFS